MSARGIDSTSGPPSIIYIIRHGEKPEDPSDDDKDETSSAPSGPAGVDIDGRKNPHSLIPRGWQRCGALAVLFDPTLGEHQAGLHTPTTLVSPKYGDPAKTKAHRTNQTILALAQRLGLPIGTHVGEHEVAALAKSLVRDSSGVVIVCWEHQHIPAIAQALPVVNSSEIPTTWPDSRFDVIWAFAAVPEAAGPMYRFSQIPQQVLSHDTNTVI
ncbi:MAG: hypothetical protein ABSB09_04145 [Acidimicrobiales bacterium]|jgi:hypothetical protein